MTGRTRRSPVTRGSGRSVIARVMALALSLFTAFAGMAVLTTTASATSGSTNITVCHATNSDTNPYEVNSPSMSSIKDANGIVSNGHGTHLGPVWTATLKKDKVDWGDIIPSFSYDYVDASGVTKTVSYEGLNWDAWGQEIWGNGCQPPAEQKTITLTCVGVSPTLTVDLKNYSAKPAVVITDNGSTIGGGSWSAGMDYYVQTTLTPNDVSHRVVVTMGGESVFDQTLSACFVAAPAIEVQKTPDSQSVVSGSTVTFTIDVTNTGNVPLTGVAVTDVLAPDCAKSIGSLAAGASITEYTCTVANVTEGFTNTAGVSGMYGTTQVSDSDTAAVTVTPVPAPAIEVQKTPDTQSVVSGSTVTFTINVSNTGNVPLTGVSVSDPLAPNCVRAYLGTLEPGASITAYTCTVSNVTEGFTNVATASGTYGGASYSDLDDAVVTVTPVPVAGIEIQKTPDTQTIASGGTATFSIVVTNTGTIPMTGVSVADPLTPGCVRASLGALAPGASTVVYTCTTGSLTAGFTNVATATGTYGEAGSISDSDSAAVTVTPPPPPPPPPGPTPTPVATPVVIPPQPVTVQEPVVIAPLPATVEEPVVIAPQPATVIIPQAAQAGSGSEAPTLPMAGWLLLLAGAGGVVISLRKLLPTR